MIMVGRHAVSGSVRSGHANLPALNFVINQQLWSFLLLTYIHGLPKPRLAEVIPFCPPPNGGHQYKDQGYNACLLSIYVRQASLPCNKDSN